MSDLIKSIVNKDYTTAKNLVNEKLEVIAERKKLEVKKMIAAKQVVHEEEKLQEIRDLTKSPAINKAIDKINKTFGPGGTHSTEELLKRQKAARDADPEFKEYKKKKGLLEKKKFKRI